MAGAIVFSAYVSLSSLGESIKSRNEVPVMPVRTSRKLRMNRGHMSAGT